MNVVNRVIIVVLILIIIVLVAVLVMAPKQSIQLGEQAMQAAGQYTANLESQNWALFASGRVIVGGTALFLCLLLLWLELRRARRKTIRVQKTAGGEAFITIESIAQRLSYTIDQLPDVVHVAPRITARSKTVDIDLLLETAPDIDVPMKTEEVLQVTKDVVEGRMGLKLGKVQVKIKHAPYPKA